MKVTGVKATGDLGTWASPETSEDKTGTKNTEPHARDHGRWLMQWELALEATETRGARGDMEEGADAMASGHGG